MVDTGDIMANQMSDIIEHSQYLYEEHCNKLENEDMTKSRAQLKREAEEFQDTAKRSKLTWQKKRNKPTNVTPKKKKRK